MPPPIPHPPESRELWLVLGPFVAGVALCLLVSVCVLRPGTRRARAQPQPAERVEHATGDEAAADTPSLARGPRAEVDG